MKKLRILLLIICILICSFTFYVNDYYHANEDTLSYIQEYDENKNLIFLPQQDSHIGLIYYPGGKVEYEAYAAYMDKLSNKGITCILIKMPFNLAILDVNAANGIIEQYPDIEQWYIGGHSLGGVVASMYIKDHLEQYSGLILNGAYANEDLSKSKLSILSIYGSEDGVLNLDKYEKNIVNLPNDFTEVIIEGGNHSGFANYGKQDGDNEALISSDTQQEQATEIIYEWMTSK